MLTNPAAFEHAVTASYVDTFHELHDPCSEGLYSSHVQVDILFVPTLTLGTVSVGVVTYRLSSPAPSRAAPPCGTHRPTASGCVPDGCATPGPHALALGRYVRDDSTGEMLLVLRPAEHGGSGAVPPPAYAAPQGVAGLARPARSVLLFHFLHHGTCYRQRTMLVCDGEWFDAEDVARSVTTVQETMEARFCLVCGAQPNAGCGCRVAEMLSPRAAAHALDHSNMVATLHSHVGGMLGQGRVICTVDAEAKLRLRVASAEGGSNPVVEVALAGEMAERLVVSPPLVSRIQICGYADPGEKTKAAAAHTKLDVSLKGGMDHVSHVRRHCHLAETLRSFVVKLSLAGANPARLVVPAPAIGGLLGYCSTGGGSSVEVGVGRVQEVAMERTVGGSGSGVFGSPDRFQFDGALAQLQGDDRVLMSEDLREDSAVGLSSPRLSNGFSDPLALSPLFRDPALLPDAGARANVAVDGYDTTFAMYSAGDGQLPGTSDALVNFSPQLLGDDSFPAPSGVGFADDLAESGAPSFLHAVSKSTYAARGSSISPPCSGPSSGSDTDKGANVARSSSPSSPPRPAPRKRGKPSTALSAGEAAEREAQRVARNRLAAARSNARRKALNDGLKDSIRLELERITALRLRQAELAAANEVLRGQVERIRGHACE
jgi:hypothetical protein